MQRHPWHYWPRHARVEPAGCDADRLDEAILALLILAVREEDKLGALGKQEVTR
jgi:hypothetical protein